MSNNNKVTLADFQKPNIVTVHWPEHQSKPHEDSSIFRIQNEELGGCDTRFKFRVNLNHFLAGAEKCAQNEVVCHPTQVADAILKDLHDTFGNYPKPTILRFGATPQCKEIIGEDYRLVATLAHQRLKNAYEESQTAA